MRIWYSCLLPSTNVSEWWRLTRSASTSHFFFFQAEDGIRDPLVTGVQTCALPICPTPFVGTENAFYERHLLFDRVIDPKVASARERFEAFSRSVRDILAQRWVQTKKTYDGTNAKRIYYLSMEFLIGRSLANNVTNLLLDPLLQHAFQEKSIDWLELVEQEPDAGLGNGGLGRLAACFLDSMATMQLPATGYGLRYEYGMFKQSIVNG